jgi:hypothetical protein
MSFATGLASAAFGKGTGDARAVWKQTTESEKTRQQVQRAQDQLNPVRRNRDAHGGRENKHGSLVS